MLVDHGDAAEHRSDNPEIALIGAGEEQDSATG
jgi:hypothetical protein